MTKSSARTPTSSKSQRKVAGVGLGLAFGKVSGGAVIRIFFQPLNRLPAESAGLLGERSPKNSVAPACSLHQTLSASKLLRCEPRSRRPESAEPSEAEKICRHLIVSRSTGTDLDRDLDRLVAALRDQVRGNCWQLAAQRLHVELPQRSGTRRSDHRQS